MQGHVCKVLTKCTKQSIYLSLQNNNVIPLCNTREEENESAIISICTREWTAFIIISLLLLDMSMLQSDKRVSKMNMFLMIRNDIGKDRANRVTGTLQSSE